MVAQVFNPSTCETKCPRSKIKNQRSKIKETNHSRCWCWVCRQGPLTYSLLEGREISTTTVEIAVDFEVPQKAETRATTRSSSTTLGYIPEGLYCASPRMPVNLKCVSCNQWWNFRFCLYVVTLRLLIGNLIRLHLILLTANRKHCHH